MLHQLYKEKAASPGNLIDYTLFISGCPDDSHHDEERRGRGRGEKKKRGQERKRRREVRSQLPLKERRRREASV
jgi:hypothetical protein